MLSLNHVALTVSNREASAEFYSRYFGLSVRVYDDEHLLILTGPGGGLLALSSGEVRSDLPRTNHFGFQADSTEQVIEMRHQFKEAGLIEAEFQEFGPTRVQLFDLDGYLVEIYAF